MKEIITHLAFKEKAEEAVKFYTSVIPNSRITGTTYFRADEPGPEGEVRTIRFEMLGQKFLAVNGGPEFSFAEGTSLLVRCDTQEEIDALWTKLGEGGETQVCGWLTDRYGLAWQIVPTVAEDFIYSSDLEASQRVVEATYKMTKLDTAELERVYYGRGAE